MTEEGTLGSNLVDDKSQQEQMVHMYLRRVRSTRSFGAAGFLGKRTYLSHSCGFGIG